MSGQQTNLRRLTPTLSGRDRNEAHYLKQYYLRQVEARGFRLAIVQAIVGNVVKDAPQWWPVLIKELVANLKRKVEVFEN